MPGGRLGSGSAALLIADAVEIASSGSRFILPPVMLRGTTLNGTKPPPSSSLIPALLPRSPPSVAPPLRSNSFPPNRAVNPSRTSPPLLTASSIDRYAVSCLCSERYSDSAVCGFGRVGRFGGVAFEEARAVEEGLRSSSRMDSAITGSLFSSPARFLPLSSSFHSDRAVFPTSPVSRDPSLGSRTGVEAEKVEDRFRGLDLIGGGPLFLGFSSVSSCSSLCTPLDDDFSSS